MRDPAPEDWQDLRAHIVARFGECVRDDCKRAAAWLRDAGALLRTLGRTTELCHRHGASAPQLCLLHASRWLRDTCEQIQSLGHARVPKHLVKRVLSPFCGFEWRVERTPPKCHRGLVVATFGWWELVPAVLSQIRRLCVGLRRRHIDVCAVTGLATSVAGGGVPAKEGYVWFGDVCDHVECAGILVSVALSRQARRLQNTPDVGSRQCIVLVGSLVVQAAYGPYVGKWHTQPHRAFLVHILDSHVRLRAEFAEGQVWTCGDFNLRGVAQGHAPEAKAGSQHSRMASWFKEELSHRGLRAQDSASTHISGSKPGGALDLHITASHLRHGVHVEWLPRRLSDHALTFVHTDPVASRDGGGAERHSRNLLGPARCWCGMTLCSPSSPSCRTWLLEWTLLQKRSLP